MKFVNIEITKKQPEAELVARRMTAAFNSSLERRVKDHKKGFSDFWDNPKVTPDEILEEWGNTATTMLAAASESLQHIGRLAAIIGKTVDDFIPARYYEPRRQFIPALGGTATLAPPAFGHDAWGLFIHVPEDPQRTGYNDANEPTYGKYADGTDIMQPLPEGAWGYTDAKELYYGEYNDGEKILTPIPDGVVGWTDAKEAIYGYEDDGVTPILEDPTPE